MTPPWLSELAPDRAPPPLGWWPLAPGWWGVIALLLLAIAVGVWWKRRMQRPSFQRWRRAALRELEQLQTASRHEGDDATLACGVQQLLRRYAVVRYGRDTVAALNGGAWIAFVVDHGGSEWTGETGQRLLRCAYGGSTPTHGDAATDRERWLAGARAFLKAGG